MTLLPCHELNAPLKLALELGLQNTDVACQAVSSLEAMEESTDPIPVAVVRTVVSLLSPYLLKQEKGLNQTSPGKIKSESHVVSVVSLVCMSQCELQRVMAKHTFH